VITTVYFDTPPFQDAWIDLTLAVTEVFWLLPAAVRHADIGQASDLFSDAVLDVAGLQFSQLPGHMQPVQQTLWVDSRQDFSDPDT
jgi:predicted metal-binding membrane protein